MRNTSLALATLAMVLSPAMALANPPCVTCVPRARAKVIVKKIIRVDPVAVFVPSYVATLAPYAIAAPTYAAPPPALAAPIAPAAPIYPSQQAVQYAAPQITPVVPVQQQVVSACPPELAAALRAINDRLCRLEDAGKIPQTPQVPLPERQEGQRAPLPGGLPRAFTKCAACHTEGKLKNGLNADGSQSINSFVMFDKESKLAKLNDKQWRKVIINAYSGAMPPKDNAAKVAPLTDEEVAELITFAGAQK